MKRSLLSVLLGALLVASCGARSDEPVVIWQGDLVELDGEVVSSGIRLEIQKIEPKEGLGRFLYRLDSGCTGVGFVSAEGTVSAAEVLRPCMESDAEVLQRLNVLTYHSQMPGSRMATLQWTDKEASLVSPEGTARFVSFQ
jgi:hypothetical protein